MIVENCIYDNGFFEFIQSDKEYIIDGCPKIVKRNFVRRPPGIRALIINKKEKKILLSREYRYELELFDYRLPGGKVFENLEDYRNSLKNDDVFQHVEETVPKEVLEEVGLIIKNPKLLKVSKAGAGVVWDLYYFEITDYQISETGPMLEENEIIEGYVWKTFEEVKQMCLDGNINEERTVGVLLTYILNDKEKK